LPGTGRGACCVAFEGNVEGKRCEMNMSVTPDDRALPIPPTPPPASPLDPGAARLFPFRADGGTPELFGGNEANLDRKRSPSAVFVIEEESPEKV
jgi:hypothetical protein